MAQYINFEAEAEFLDAESGKEDDEVSFVSESSLIDNQEIGNDADFYRFTNPENDIDQVLAEAEEKALADIEQFDEVSNLCDSSDSESQINDFKESQIDITKFKATSFPRVHETQQKIENQFCKAVLYAIKFDKNGSKDVCTQEGFQKLIDKNLIEQLNQPEKFKFIIELQTFMNMCYEMNSILSNFGYFL